MTEIKLTNVLTSNNTSNGNAFSDEKVVSNGFAFKAFDNELFVENSGWQTNYLGLGAYLGYEFTERAIVTRYKIYPYVYNNQTGLNRSPKSWTFEGWNGTRWVILDIRSNITWTYQVPQEFNVTNVGNFIKYRLNISSNNGDTWGTSIAQLELYGRYSTDKVLISYRNNKTASFLGKIKFDSSIPIMTSATSPSGIVKASSTLSSGFEPFRAFDNDGSTRWQTPSISSGGVGWISYEFSSQKKIGKYSIVGNDAAINHAPKKWTFEGSNNGIDWTVLDTQSNQVFTLSERKEFLIKKPELFKEYKLNISQNNGNTYLSLAQIDMYESSGVILKVLNDYAESNFVNHGMSQSDLESIDLFADFTEKHYIQDTSTVLESGKVFEHTLDTNKVLKKIKF